jgi:hypothetical protein
MRIGTYGDSITPKAGTMMHDGPRARCFGDDEGRTWLRYRTLCLGWVGRRGQLARPRGKAMIRMDEADRACYLLLSLLSFSRALLFSAYPGPGDLGDIFVVVEARIYRQPLYASGNRPKLGQDHWPSYDSTASENRCACWDFF